MPARDDDKQRIKDLEQEVTHLQKQVDDLEQKVKDQEDWGKDVTWKAAQHAQELQRVRAEGYRAAAVLGGPDYSGPDVKVMKDGNWVSKDQRPDTANKFWIERMGFDNPRLGGSVEERAVPVVESGTQNVKDERVVEAEDETN